MIDLVKQANDLIQRLNEAMVYCSGKRKARLQRICSRASARWSRRYLKT